MKTKTALLFKNKNNYLDEQLEQAFSYGLKKIGFKITYMDIDELSEKVDSMPIENLDIIAFDVQLNSLFASGRRRAYMYEQLFERAKEGALTLYTCDTSLPLQPHLWDKNESHATHKRNVMNSRPVKVIASLNPKVKQDTKAMNKLDSLWMSKLHPDSTIHFIEWVSSLIHTYSFDDENTSKVFEGEKIRYFYYGMSKSFLAKSLTNCGMTDEKDLVYGSISRNLKRYPIRKINERVTEPLSWLKYANNAQYVLFPYEPVKSDYQITLRLLEALMFYKDKIVFDERVNKDLHKYAQDERHWYAKSNETTQLMKQLYLN